MILALQITRVILVWKFKLTLLEYKTNMVKVWMTVN